VALAVRIPIFNIGSVVYDVMTGQTFWRQHIAHLLDYAPDEGAGLRVLDLGCGPGVSTFVLAQKLGCGSSLVGIDLASRMIARAEQHHRRRFADLDNVSFEQADATSLRFADASFDLAVGHSFLYLVPDRGAVLREVRRVLAPGGRLVLMEPNQEASLLHAAREGARRWQRAARHPWDASLFLSSMVGWRAVSASAGRMTPAALERAFRDAGFTDVAAHPTLAGLGVHCVGSAQPR